jgi:NosR/NirI family nitrous oxide reductase transcriptional regulator
MIQVRLKREKFEALSSPATRGKGPPKPPVITHGGEPVGTAAKDTSVTG